MYCSRNGKNLIHLTSEDDGTEKIFIFNKKDKEFLLNVFNYQTIVLNECAYIEYKNLLYMFVEIIMERLMEI